MFFWLAGRVDGGGYPAEVDQDEVVSCEEPVGNPEMLKIIKRGRALAPSALKNYGLKGGSLPTNWTDWDGVQHDVTHEGAADTLRKRLHPMAVPAQRGCSRRRPGRRRTAITSSELPASTATRMSG